MSEKKPTVTSKAAKKPAQKTATAHANQPVAKRSRLRGKIYGPRRLVSFRLEETDHVALMQYCEDEGITAQNYLLALMRADLKKKKRL